MLLATIDLASSAEAVTILGFAGGIGAGITKLAARRRRGVEEESAKTKATETQLANLSDAMIGHKAQGILPERIGVIEQQERLTLATRELTAAVAEIRAQLAEHIEGHTGVIG